ncbi:MAG TPA: glutamine synthetase beta-grasp domain-containing protein [Rectinemataceae bacterium]|nr:glutamine synthetase beta-grasp domain-containing protein [Rectinemataceae bacterium]
MDLEAFDGDFSKIDYVSFLVVDLAGELRSVSLPRRYATEKILAKGIGFDASNFGYADVRRSDMVAVPELSTGFVENKDGFRILHAFCDVLTTDGEPFAHYPRAVARKALEHLRASGLGDDAKMLVELEFYVFDEVSYSTTAGHSYYRVGSAEGIGAGHEDAPRFGASKGYHRLAPDDRYGLLRNRAVKAMEAAGIPVKYHHHEVAASQLEIELDFMSIAKAGDAVVLAKWIIRSTADELGLHVTFMPKPIYGLAGSGMHVHQFVEKGGASVFPGEALHGLSREGLAWAAGILEHSLSGALLAWSNPSTNSYRRLIPGFEAPVAATIDRGSRAAAIRIPGYLRKGEARIEFRTGDATANVYFHLAAMLLAGLDGVKRGLDPVALGFTAADEKGGGTGIRSFPTGLFHVLSGLDKDRTWLAPVFPDELIDAWIARKRKEAEYVYNAPVPQEYELYF